MILVSHLRDFTRPDKIVRELVPWGIGCTARELAPSWAEPDDPLVGCSRNGGKLEDWDVLLADGDHVHYWARPGLVIESTSLLLVSIANAVLFSAYSFLIQRVLFPIRKPESPDQDSQTYAFNNLQRNLRGEGVPIPVVYGRTRVAPPIINEYVRSGIDTNGQPTSEYLALCLIGEGPIHAIGVHTANDDNVDDLSTLELNNQPAANFEGVEMHVRLGTFDQTAIAEFADPVLDFNVDKTLRDSDALTHTTAPTDTPSATTAIASPGSFSPSDVNVTKWDKHERYIAGDDAHEFTAALEFPRGLVAYTAGGSELSNNIILQARYQQVDSGGVPFGNVVVLPAQQFTLTRTGLVRLELRNKFRSVSNYAPPNLGFYAISRATAQANPGIGYAAVLNTFVPAAPASLQFSFSCWMRRRNVQAIGTTNRIFQWFDVAGIEGFRLNVIRDSSTISTVQFQFGTGAVISSPAQSLTTYAPLSTDTTLWHNLIVTYEASYDGTNTRTRFYLDGTLRFTDSRAGRAVLDSAQPIRLMSDSATSPTLGYDGQLDETTFWSRTLTAYEVSTIYNGGNPIGIDAAASGLIVGARFDIQQGASPNVGTPAFGPYFVPGQDWILGSGTNGASDPDIAGAGDPQNGIGIVKTPESGTLVSDPSYTGSKKFLVDIMRLDTEDTSFNAVSECIFRSIQLRTFQQYEYPGMALLAVRVLANDQLEGSAPLITVRVDGRLVPVWDGQNAVYPNLVPTYSRNPAWVAVDAALNQDFGLGSVYKTNDIDVIQFAAAAAVWDTLIYDNQDRAALVEARYLDSASEAVTFSGTNLGAIHGDVVRYKTVLLPPNFQQVSSVADGRKLVPILTGLTPSPPTWLTNQAALAPQEVVFVEFSGGHFYTYTLTTLGLGPGQSTYTVSGGSTTSNGLEMRDVRARFDGVFDRADFGAWDAIIQILQMARAAPMRIGSRLSVFYDDVSPPVALVGMGNIVEGSWRQGFMGVGDRPNAESADFNDEQLNWERSQVADEHPDITNPGNQSSYRWRRVSLEGITRRGQARRYLRRDLNIFKLVRRWCEFGLGIDALPIMPGDVLAVSHDVPQYGFSGRIYDTSTNTTVRLSRPITLAAATSYQVQVEDAASGNRYTVAVTQASGTYAAGDSLSVAAFPASFAPAKNDKYAIGEVAKGEVKLFRLVESTFDPLKLERKCRCLEYDAQVYSDDFGIIPAISPSALPVPQVPTVPPGVENLTATEVTTRGPDGSVRIGARVTFDHFADTFSSVGSSDVYVGVGDNLAGLGAAHHVAHLDARSTSVLVEYPFARDQLYTIWVVPRTRSGAGAYRTFAAWAPFMPSGLARVPRPPASLSATIAGERVVYTWTDDDALDHGATIEARQGGWILGVPVMIEPAQARTSKPDLNWNSSPTNALGIAETPIFFRTKLRTGQYSEAGELTFAPSVASADGNVLERNEENNEWGTS